MRLSAWGLVLPLLLSLGCDRDSGQSASPPAAKKGPSLMVEVRGVTPLPPDRRTHVAASGTGQVFWVQEAEAGGRETLFAMSDGGLPAATKFSNASVAEAMGQAGVTGSIQSLAVGSDRRVYFFFSGGTRRAMACALGAFTPETGQTKVLAGTAALAGVSGMGDSLALARGSIVRVGNVIWLWLRHDDGYALLALDLGRPGAELRRPFPRLFGEGAPKLTSAGEDLTAGIDGSLMYLDRGTGKVWQVGPVGESKVLRDLSDLPKDLAAPGMDDAGRMIVFAPEGRAFDEREDEVELPSLPKAGAVEYPALVIYEGAERTVLGRRRFDAPGRLNLRALAPRQLVRDRSGWLAYDGQTGELLRLVVVER